MGNNFGSPLAFPGGSQPGPQKVPTDNPWYKDNPDGIHIYVPGGGAPTPGRSSFGPTGGPTTGAAGSDNNSAIGGALGTSSYQPNNAQFNLPQLPQYEYMAATGAGAQGATMGQQSVLGNMLLAQAHGGGYNPATQQLQNATDANNRSAMSMAQSMNGAPGGNMAAQRNILETQAMNNQQAAGQAAQLRGQTALNAQGQLQSLLGQEQQGQLGWGNLGLNANEGQLNGQLSLQQILAGAYGNQTNKLSQAMGGAASGAGSAASSIPWGSIGGGAAAVGGGVGAGLLGGGSKSVDPEGPGVGPQVSPAMPDPGGGTGGGSMAAAHGGMIPSHGAYAMGLQHGHMLAMLMGGHVPGRASVDGDSSQNDTIDAKLSPGEIVLPRSITQDKDAAEKARLFVEAIKKKKK